MERTTFANERSVEAGSCCGRLRLGALFVLGALVCFGCFVCFGPSLHVWGWERGRCTNKRRARIRAELCLCVVATQ